MSHKSNDSQMMIMPLTIMYRCDVSEIIRYRREKSTRVRFTQQLIDSQSSFLLLRLLFRNGNA